MCQLKRNISSPPISQNGDINFLSDAEIIGSIPYVVAKNFLWVYWFNRWFHDVKVVGGHHLSEGGPGLCVGHHTTHNNEIFIGLFAIEEATGIVLRGQMHRIAFRFFWWLKYLGISAGDRTTSTNLIKNGFYPACMPGGLEEALSGHENAYRLDWKSKSGTIRTGFVRACQEVEEPTMVYGIYADNAEETRFNIAHWLCNLLYISHLFTEITKILGNHSARLQNIWFHIGAFLWVWSMMFNLPFPAKATIYILPGISIDPNDDANEMAEKVSHTLETFIRKDRPTFPSKDYRLAFKDRFFSSSQSIKKMN